MMSDALNVLRRYWTRLRTWWRRKTRDTSTPSPSLWDPDGHLGRKLRDPDHRLELHGRDDLDEL